MDKVAPEVTKLIRVRHRQPWYNDQIKNEKVKLRKSERRWRQSGNKAHYVVFMHQKNFYTLLLRKIKENYYSNQINENKNDQKKDISNCQKSFTSEIRNYISKM